VLDLDAPLWNEGRALVEQELREPRTYFGILTQLAGGPKQLNEIAQPLRLEVTSVIRYLQTLQDLHLVSRATPFGSKPTSKSGHWQLDDPFLRFWFRFVFPYQSDLDAGLSPEALFDADVRPHLAEHVSPVFEAWCGSWLRRHRAELATTFGRWWGRSANRFRRSGERSSEEIDAVGGRRNGTVTLVAEAKWTSKVLSPAIVDELRTYKIPALVDAGLDVVDDPTIVLFAKRGYTPSLRDLAAADSRIQLIDVEAALAARE
jgi:AAA+ ATPase superfamily predicted ATPase